MSGVDRICRFAEPPDLPEIRRLWRDGFPEDTGEEIDEFLRRVNLSSECLLALEGSRAVSMAFLLPAVLTSGEERWPVWYLYAAATRADRRGEGLFRELLTAAEKTARKTNRAAIFLRPASQRLSLYYERLGFEPFFCCESGSGQAKPAERLAVSVISPAEYAARRAKVLPETAVLWEPRFLHGTVCMPEGLAVCEPRNGTLYVRELLCAPQERERLCAGLAAHFACERFAYRAPVTAEQGEFFGWINWLKTVQTKGIPYMGIALD